MSGAGPGSSGTPEEVWQMFLDDSEDAIRVSAPRELSARDRERDSRPAAERVPAADSVGELWRPEVPRNWPAWRELDSPARVRRAARVFVGAAAVVVALTAWSQFATGSGAPADTPVDTTVQRVEEAPIGLPTAAVSPAPSVTAPVTAASWSVG
ncbi:hypothetical protein [Streptomyces ziwulingensis]|uniref:hypothetical protein n=1 Tax=Streptomyces ziwulingensis TaxID=1045501 RepID=UPI0031ED7429